PAVLAEAGEQSLNAVIVDIAGLWISRQIGPGDASLDDGGHPDVETVFPDLLSRFFIEADHAFLRGLFRAHGAVEVDVAVEDQRRGPAAKGRYPDEVVLARLTKAELGRQIFLRREAVVQRPAPVGPVAGRGR